MRTPHLLAMDRNGAALGDLVTLLFLIALVLVAALLFGPAVRRGELWAGLTVVEQATLIVFSGMFLAGVLIMRT